jgi:hypothetical protein
MEAGVTTGCLPTGCKLGFLTVLHEPAGYVGGYLVTNAWGRPLEFRLSTAVQPNRVQQILYGPTLEPYLCADLIGKTLIDKTSTAADLIITDQAAAVEVRWRVDVPVAHLTPHAATPPGLRPHERFAADEARIGKILEGRSGLDLAEPFVRIREAIAEARKLGATSRG